ncbi:MAG: diacylglycerol kinase family lipid kinase [Armatimonadetes bacterium]|nr:diacylglycerol kinase family lipid kinase [Armatimonadota bacterium]
MSVFLLSNPNSGGNSSNSWLETARRRMGERLGRWTEVSLRPGESITALIQELLSEATTLFVAGGDGTVRAAAQALQGTDIPLAILPTGTVNVMARELGVPLLDPYAAVDLGLSGLERRIDLGVCNGETFLLVCSGGVDSATVGQVNEGLKSAVGATAYALAAVGALATFTPPWVRVTIDGIALPEVEVFLVAVSNTSLYGGDLKLLPAASLEDGLLDIALFTAPPLPAAVRNAAFLPQLADAALGRQTLSDNIWIYQGRHITLESHQPLQLQKDGDLGTTTPAVFTVVPSALRVKAPLSV